MKRKTRTPQYQTDRDGRQVVLMPLANHALPAELYAEDYEWLRSQGSTDQWTLNGTPGYGYVRCGVDGLQTVARLLIRADPGVIVRYRDGNRLNLRTDNLRRQHGMARRAAVIPEAHKDARQNATK